MKLVLFCPSVQHHNYYFVECGHVWFALNRIGWPVPGVQWVKRSAIVNSAIEAKGKKTRERFGSGRVMNPTRTKPLSFFRFAAAIMQFTTSLRFTQWMLGLVFKFGDFDRVCALSSILVSMFEDTTSGLWDLRIILFNTNYRNQCLVVHRQVAMRLLEKDIHDKQDTLVSIRRQLEDVKKLNLELHNKLQVTHSHYWQSCRLRRVIRLQNIDWKILQNAKLPRLRALLNTRK